MAASAIVQREFSRINNARGASQSALRNVRVIMRRDSSRLWFGIRAENAQAATIAAIETASTRMTAASQSSDHVRKRLEGRRQVAAATAAANSKAAMVSQDLACATCGGSTWAIANLAARQDEWNRLPCRRRSTRERKLCSHWTPKLVGKFPDPSKFLTLTVIDFRVICKAP